MRLATSLYDWLLFLHILAASVWLGGLIMISLLATLVLRSRDPELVKRFIGSTRIAGAAFGPSMLAVLGFGIWMVVDSPAWDFGQAWVIAALGLFAAAFAIGVAFQARAAIGAQRAAEGGDHDEASRQLRRWAWGMEAIVVILVVAVWDMVAKPGL
jgi:putative membrane protein